LGVNINNYERKLIFSLSPYFYPYILFYRGKNFPYSAPVQGVVNIVGQNMELLTPQF
jgi:hypothetical protein